jgi:hypothetical protein
VGRGINPLVIATSKSFASTRKDKDQQGPHKSGHDTTKRIEVKLTGETFQWCCIHHEKRLGHNCRMQKWRVDNCEKNG